MNAMNAMNAPSRLRSLIAAFAFVAAFAAASLPAAAATLPVAATVTLPVREASGDVAQMVTQFFLPPGTGPFPVVLFSHGRAPGESGRAELSQGVSRAQLRYWLAKGVAVVSPIRPGYGASTGGDVEQSGVRHDQFGRCTSKPDYRKTAEAATLTVPVTLDWLKTQPWADANHVLLVGQSVGGLTTVAAGARPLPGVVGYINFAGGSGGSPERSPGASCDPDQLTQLYAGWGRTTTLPNLWVYAANDQYWGPDEPRAWHAAFARGGSPSTFVQAPAVADGDGHGLSRHAEALWSDALDAFITRIGFPGKAALAARAPSPQH
ncbi:MAG: dipeptidyl aminopeptidase [Betaproteobacteria bacterium]